MNYTFKEAERELDNLFDKLIDEANTDKEKHYLNTIWKTYKEWANENTYEEGYADGCYDIHGRYQD